MNRPDKLSLQPKTFVLKHVRADLKTLLLNLGEAAAQAKIGEAGEVLGVFFRAMESVRIERPPEELAWQLVCDGLARATTELLRFDDEQASPTVIYDGDLDHLKNRTDILVKEADLAITRDFFRNPSALPILGGVERTLASWLRFLQPNEPNASRLNESQASAVAARLRGYFPVALHEEWRRHRDRYSPVFEYFDTPFAKAAEMAWDWERNRLELIRQMDLPVFEETFSLRQVYVPLRAYTLEGIESDKPSQDRRKRRCRIFMLEDEIAAWLKRGPKAGDDIRLVTGGPGSGKSTFAKWLAAELSEKRRVRILFIPLQRVRILASLKEAIASYLTETKRFQQSPLAQEDFASTSDPLLLIFDGLDELTKPGDLADEQTKLFIEELRHHLGLWNEGGVKVLALITGRTVYAQAKRPLLRITDRQEVSVLPFLIDGERKSELCEHGEVSGEELLENDQREQWWASYSVAKGLHTGSLPEVFKNNHDLRELTADPLLNYLVVLSGFHEDLASDTDINRNRIYARLLKDVLDRRHAKRADTDKVALAAVDDAKDRDKFERLLETVALAAWYGDGRTTTRAEIENLLPQDSKAAWQELVTGGPGFTRLIAAFYMRQTEGSTTSDAVEFTHKSFGEYLTARRLMREIERICKGRRDSADYYGERQALEEWAKLTGAQAMTMDFLRFLRDEVALRPKDDVKTWQDTLTSLLDLELKTGLPINALPSDSFRPAEQLSRNAEEALLAAVNACAHITHQRVTVNWPHALSAGSMLHRLRGQRHWRERSVTLACLGGFELSTQNLYCQDLDHGDLSKAALVSAYLFGADLSDAKLIRTDFTDAELIRALLLRADLSGANLRRAHLGLADVSEANLSDANLTGANLSGVNLKEANVRGAKLMRANLSDANLSEANLTGANLSGADLSGADLSGANLSGANLSDANLDGAKNLMEGQLVSASAPTSIHSALSGPGGSAAADPRS